MTNQQLQSELSQLFKETARAHHAAYADSEGANPDWPIWYADHLLEPMQQLVNKDLYKSQLIYCLMTADFDYVARAPATGWTNFYASEFVQHFAASETASEDKLALYTMASCPFCQHVMSVIERLGLDIEMRNIYADRALRDELLEARGRATVPVLWIQAPDGSVRWMPESQDIIHYLESMYG